MEELKTQTAGAESLANLLEVIQNSNANALRVVFTVLDGEHMAEKALTVGGRLVWESRENGYFSDHREELAEVSESKTVILGESRVFCDVLGQEKHLVICGAGHVSIPVIRMGIMLGFRVTVLEDRPSFADNARRAGASEVICEPFETGLDRVEGSGDTYFVIVTRGHRYDQICLEKIAEKEHAYIGMIGSRRRTTMLRQNLLERGVDRALLESVHTPIGLDIGAETPEEIAVAIVAEIIDVKNKRGHSCGYPREIIKAVMDREQDPGDKVLATIVARKGSAPRGVGTKMLIFRDHRCIGTIGGGCMEADVVQQALLMLSEDSPKARICRVDMTGADAEDEGMVCGGIVDVLLEAAGQPGRRQSR